MAINDAGTVVGTEDVRGPGVAQGRGFRWKGSGSDAAFDWLEAGDDASLTIPYAINASGVVAGITDYFDSFVAIQASIWPPGDDARSLPFPSTHQTVSFATGINSQGNVLGEIRDSFGFGRMYIWENGNAVAVAGAPEGALGYVLTDTGIIGGTLDTVDEGKRPLILSEGTATILPTGSWTNGSLYDLSESGYGVGEVFQSGINFNTIPAMWTGGLLLPLELPEGFDGGVARAVNENGIAVGSVWSSHTGLNEAVMWGPDGSVVRLNELIAGLDWMLAYASDINSRSEIVGTAFSNSGSQRGFLLTPVPEPGGLVAVVGLVGLGMRRR